MRPNCAAGKHEIGSRWARNQGLDFGCCRKCGRDLVRSRGSAMWRTVPKGFRVVWRRGAEPWAEPSAAQLLLNLPASGRSLAVPASRPPRKSRAAAAVELVAMGARCLAWAVTDCVSAWARFFLTRRLAPQPVLSLPAS